MSNEPDAKLIDTHCHLDFSDFDNDREEVIQRARGAGVTQIINIGSSLAASKRSIDLAHSFDFIYATLGLHPHEAENFNHTARQEINTLMNNEKIVAIGEIGLDYYFRHPVREDIKELQENLFRSLIDIAIEKGLPLVIHNRDADADLLRIIKDYFKNQPLRGVIHCFSSNRAFLEICLDLGFYISFTCNITYKKADNLRELVEFLPIDRLLLETDAPFLSPQIFRGRRNEPANVEILATQIAKIKNLSFNKVAEQTTKNAKDLFALP